MITPQLPAVDRDRTLELERFLPQLVWLLPLLVYAATLRFQFIYDDNQQILNDPLIRSWHNLPLLLKVDVWRFWNPGVIGNYWRPLFMLWLVINYKIFGLNPIGWHLTSVLVHVAATWLCFVLVRRITGEKFIATTAALIFGLHPVHLETVAWVSGVTDSLMSVFFLSSLLCFIHGWESQGKRRYGYFVISSLLFACSLLTKETAVVLPGIVVGYVLLFPREHGDGVRHRFASLLLPLLLYAAVIAAYFTERHAVLQGFDHGAIRVGVQTYLLTCPSFLWFYLSHLIWPSGLSIFYDRPVVSHADWSHFWMPLLGIMIGTVTTAIGISKERGRGAYFGALLLLLPLAPTFALPLILPNDYAHDRYLYLPCLGFGILAALLLQQLGERLAARMNGRYVMLGLASGIVVALATSTSVQMVHWANDLLLYDRAAEIAPGNLMSFEGLGRSLLAVGRPTEAISAFQQVLKVNPNDWAALHDLGLHDFQNRNYPESERYLKRAAALRTSDSDNAALLAEVLNREGKFAEAEPFIRHALDLRPRKPGYRRVLAESLDGQGKKTDAMLEIEGELKDHPEDVESQELLKQLQSKRDTIGDCCGQEP